MYATQNNCGTVMLCCYYQSANLTVYSSLIYVYWCYLHVELKAGIVSQSYNFQYNAKMSIIDLYILHTFYSLVSLTCWRGVYLFGFDTFRGLSTSINLKRRKKILFVSNIESSCQKSVCVCGYVWEVVFPVFFGERGVHWFCSNNVISIIKMNE